MRQLMLPAGSRFMKMASWSRCPGAPSKKHLRCRSCRCSEKPMTRPVRSLAATSVSGTARSSWPVSGARGSMLNLTQMAGCIGQQSVRGERIVRGYDDRTLPHFRKGERGADAHRFIAHSYKGGLNPTEFFFHAIGGREGLVDTAVPDVPERIPPAPHDQRAAGSQGCLRWHREELPGDGSSSSSTAKTAPTRRRVHSAIRSMSKVLSRPC